jgi:hypothetical protein
MAHDPPPRSLSLRPTRKCAGCGLAAPQVRTLGTLAQHGWRLRVSPGDGAKVATEYYCPECCATLTGSPPLHNR